MCHSAECQFADHFSAIRKDAECHSAKCHSAECHFDGYVSAVRYFAECRSILIGISLLYAILLNAILLNVVLLGSSVIFCILSFR